MDGVEATQNAEQPVINIVGEKVGLGPFHKGLLSLFHQWSNDFEVSFFSGDELKPITRESVDVFYEKENKEENPRHVDFVIFDYATKRPIGMVGLRHIWHKNRSAEMGIGICEKEYWSKGYGTEAVRLILDYGFSVLGLHNIMLTTYGYNERAINAYQKAGFKIIGRRREAHRWANKYYDEVIMDCLDTEFETPLKRILTLPE